MITRFDLLVDVGDLTVLANDVCPAFRDGTRPVNDSVGLGNVFSRIAENRVIEFQLFRKCRVLFNAVTAGCEVGNVEFTQGFAARTERQTLLCSSTGECFGIPGDDDRLLPLEVR